MNRTKLALLLLLPMGPVLAEEPGVAGISLQAVSLEAGPLEGLWIWNGSERVSLSAPADHFQRPVSYTGPNPLTLFAERRAPGEDEDRFHPVGQVHLPPHADTAILLLRRDGNGVRGEALPLLEKGLADGGLFLVNLGEREVLLSLGEDAVRIERGRSRFIRPKTHERGVLPMAYRFADDPENLSLVSSGWFHHPERLFLVFLFENEGQVGLRSLTWFPARD